MKADHEAALEWANLNLKEHSTVGDVNLAVCYLERDKQVKELREAAKRIASYNAWNDTTDDGRRLTSVLHDDIQALRAALGDGHD